jgi:hypothetical protein
MIPSASLNGGGLGLCPKHFLAWEDENLTRASSVERKHGYKRNLKMKIMS